MQMEFSFFIDIPSKSFHCKPVPVQYRECEYGFFFVRHNGSSIITKPSAWGSQNLDREKMQG